MENVELVYDDEQATRFIIGNLKKKGILMSEEDVEYLMDILYDFYDEMGIIIHEDEEESEVDDIDFDHEQMVEYILDTLKEENNEGLFTTKQIEAFLEAEMAYCESIGIIKE